MKPTRSPASPYALEKVRSTATLGRSRYTAMPSGTSGSRTYSEYASSSTTRQSGGTRSRNAVSSPVCTTVPVGLFGLHTKITRVRLVIASAIASRWWVSARRGTVTGSAADSATSIG